MPPSSGPTGVLPTHMHFRLQLYATNHNKNDTLLGARYCSTHLNVSAHLISQQCYEIVTTIIPILQVRKPRHREVNELPKVTQAASERAQYSAG